VQVARLQRHRVSCSGGGGGGGGAGAALEGAVGLAEATDTLLKFVVAAPVSPAWLQGGADALSLVTALARRCVDETGAPASAGSVAAAVRLRRTVTHVVLPALVGCALAHAAHGFEDATGLTDALHAAAARLSEGVLHLAPGSAADQACHAIAEGAPTAGASFVVSLLAEPLLRALGRAMQQERGHRRRRRECPDASALSAFCRTASFTATASFT
jgi:hypothetical protein